MQVYLLVTQAALLVSHHWELSGQASHKTTLAALAATLQTLVLLQLL